MGLDTSSGLGRGKDERLEKHVQRLDRDFSLRNGGGSGEGPERREKFRPLALGELNLGDRSNAASGGRTYWCTVRERSRVSESDARERSDTHEGSVVMISRSWLFMAPRVAGTCASHCLLFLYEIRFRSSTRARLRTCALAKK